MSGADVNGVMRCPQDAVIAAIYSKVDTLAEAQEAMRADFKGSLTGFLLIAKILTVLVGAALLVQMVLLVVLILRDSPRDFRATRDGFSITGPSK